MEVDPKDLPIPQRYGLMISSILPRPIAWVSTISPQGILNLAPFSFFTGICAEPLTLCFAPSNDRNGRKKDTLLNVQSTRQFVVNIVSEDLAQAMNQTSAEYPYGISEFEKAGLTPKPSIKVRPPGVQESPIQLECELDRIVVVSEGPLGGNLVLGRVVFMRVADKVLKDGNISHEKLRPLGRMSGSWYSRVTDCFELPRPPKPS